VAHRVETCSAATGSALSGCRDNGGKSKKRVRILVMIYWSIAARRQACCIAEHCLHRRASLSSASSNPVDPLLLPRLKYDAQGKCIERPFEARSPENLCLPAYPLQELADFCLSIWARIRSGRRFCRAWDVMVRSDGRRNIVVLPVHDCNWLQIQENTSIPCTPTICMATCRWSITCRPWHRGVILPADRSL